MQGAPTNPTPDRVVVHPLDAGDAAIAAAARAATKAVKGVRLGVEGRAQYDAFMEGVSPAEGLKVEKDAVGGVQGVWVRPAHARPDEAILYLHGGWFNFGSAWAYRSFVGHIAKRARADAFIVDYRLAPEHPFPAAIDDALASYRALGAQGVRRIAVVGDSAGGNLTLALASRVIGAANSTPATLVGAVAFSPVTDLTLSGASYETRAEADPLFTRRKSRTSWQPIWAAPIRSFRWRRRSKPTYQVCRLSGFTLATMKCCWMTRCDMASAPLQPALTHAWTCGWAWDTGSS
jgi:monoterpene epsilon-lactone hydrolase